MTVPITPGPTQPQPPIPLPIVPPPKKPRSQNATIALIAVVLVGTWVGFIGLFWLLNHLGDGSGGEPRDRPAASDVEVIACYSSGGELIAELLVKNSTAETRSYLITVGFYDAADTRVARATVDVRTIRAGASERAAAKALLGGRGADGCRVDNAQRR